MRPSASTIKRPIDVLYDLLWHEGLFLGGSVGINVAAAVELARRLGPGHRIVTVLCDGGDRYRSRIWNKEWLQSRGCASQNGSHSVASLKSQNSGRADPC